MKRINQHPDQPMGETMENLPVLSEVPRIHNHIRWLLIVDQDVALLSKLILVCVFPDHGPRYPSICVQECVTLLVWRKSLTNVSEILIYLLTYKRTPAGLGSLQVGAGLVLADFQYPPL